MRVRKLLFLVGCLSLLGCNRKPAASPDPELVKFFAAKRTQAQELADLQTNEVPAKVWRFFDQVQRNDWNAATNLYGQLLKESRYDEPGGRRAPLGALIHGVRRTLGLIPTAAPGLRTEIWAPIVETYGAYEAFHDWDPKWLRRFSRDVIASIPPGSIYFGGTDPGRFVISAFSTAHRAGRPFFTVTQNALADGTYLDYLRAMYGQLQLPTPDDSQRAFQNYLQDAQERVRKNELKPGEDVKIVANRVQVSGQVAVMTINGLIAKVIVEKNPTREIYVEESFPLDWMYPQLQPHGLILKLERAPLADLSAAVVAHDRAYWSNYTAELIGGWLTLETSVKEICDFTERIYLRKDLAGFKGDAGYARNAPAQKTFSKLRSAIAGLYAWRAEHATAAEEQSRLTQEADFAFRQAIALCPNSPEAVFRYVNLLLTQKRFADARLVAQVNLKLTPKEDQARELVERLQKAEWSR